MENGISPDRNSSLLIQPQQPEKTNIKINAYPFFALLTLNSTSV
jgi:hypothetical protein